MMQTVRPFFLLAIVLLVVAFSEHSMAAEEPPKRSKEYSTYLEYLAFRRLQIDAATHHDLNRRESALSEVSRLGTKFKELDIKPVRKVIAGNPTERNLVLSRLKIEAEKLPQMALLAQAELAVAKGPKSEISEEELETLAARAEWLEQRSEFVLEEQSKFLVGAGVSTRGASLYWAVLALEEKRIEAGIEADEKKRSVAESMVELQEKQLGGVTLDSARLELTQRDASLAVRKLRAELREIPRKLDALAFHPVKRDTLLETQKLYKAEAASLVKQIRGE